MITLIDNYDSFTYNIVQYLGKLGQVCHVVRNDQKTVAEILSEKPKAIVISPGPSDPDHAGICLEMIKACADLNMPLLGVCLGHQAIGQSFGGKIVRAPAPMHGKISKITHQGQSVFAGIPSPLSVTRYHSLIVERSTFPSDLMVTADTEDSLVMGLCHRTKPIHGVQFHPESIATEHGMEMLQNFVKVVS